MNQLGYYGKTPHRGDFVRFNLPQSFVKVWDDWLQHVIVSGEQKHDDWALRYKSAPAYRFVLSSGIAGNDVWIGLLQPSQDKVGRRFPFCLAMSLAESTLPCVAITSLSAWFDDAEALMARVLSTDYRFDDLQTELATLANAHAQPVEFAAGNVLSLSPRIPEPLSVCAPSSSALDHPLSAPALLDAVLMQTISEYSLWTSKASPADVTILSAGLPVDNAGIALFTMDYDSSATSVLNLAALSLCAGASPEPLNTEPTNGASSHKIEENPEQVATASEAAIEFDHSLDTRHEQAQTETETDTGTDELPLEQTLFSDEDTVEHTDENSATLETVPTADDWAALEDFEDTAIDADKIIVPEIERLELDDDDLPDAPWEK